MRLLIGLICWCILLVLAWPLALLVLLVAPLVLLLAIPFGVIGLMVQAMMALLAALLFAPARLLGHRSYR